MQVGALPVGCEVYPEPALFQLAERSGSRCARTARIVVCAELEQEHVQRPALLGVERGEELLLDLLRDCSQLSEGCLPDRCEADEMTATVAGITAALDEVLLLELVEQPDKVASVVTEGVGDRGLGLARPFLQERQHRVVLGIQPRGLEGL